MKMLGPPIIGIAMLASSGYGQTLVGAGYDDPSAIRIAPGQMVSLFVTGLKTVLPQGSAKATQIPLPTSLAGISVTFSQTPSYSQVLPLLSIDQFNHCSDSKSTAPDCLLTAITVQMPFEMTIPNPIIDLPFQSQPTTSLVVMDNGTATQSFAVSPVPDQIHVLQSCDIGGQTRGTGVCFSIVTHLDGGLVLQAPRGPNQIALSTSEARPGEVLTMYAYGLGQVSSVVQPGSLSPNPPATVLTPIYLQFDYHPNASASMPIYDSPLTLTAQPLFAGLTPGQVGLYQINFVVPKPPPTTANCGASVESNLTISVGSANGQSFGGASICVDNGPQ